MAKTMDSVHSLIHSSLSSKVELPERGSLIFQSDLILRAIPRRATFSRKEWDYNFSGFQPTLALRGLPYMTSALGGGGGSQKSRQKEQNQLISAHDKGIKKSKNVSDVINGSPLVLLVCRRVLHLFRKSRMVDKFYLLGQYAE